MIKLFNYKTVAAVVTGRLFDDLDEVNDLMRYMTGSDVRPHNAQALRRQCRYYFVAQYPALDTVHMENCTPVYFDCYEADFNDILGTQVPVEEGVAAIRVAMESAAESR